MIYTQGKDISTRKNLSGGVDIIVSVNATANSSISNLQGVATRKLKKYVIVKHVASLGYEGFDGKHYKYAYRVIEN